jgi:hypothetical protein
LKLQQLAPTENFVDRHLLGDVTKQSPHSAGIGQPIDAGDRDAAGIGREEGAEDAQSRGFTGTVGPQEPIEAACRDAQAEIIQGLDRSQLGAAAITFSEVLELDQARISPETA